MKKTTSAFLMLFSLYAYGENTPSKPIPKEGLQRFATVYSVIQSDYVTEPDDAKLLNACVESMVHSLDDKSTFIDTDEFKSMMERKPQPATGIQIAYRSGLPTVIAAIEGSPSQRAGIKPKDYILSIDGESMEGATLDEALQKMKGELGSSVVLTIRRPGEMTERSFKLVRENFASPKVAAKLIKPHIGYIRIPTLQASTSEEFRSGFAELEKQDNEKLGGLVIDVRNNPGGILPSAIEIASIFLPDDTLLFSLKGRLPEANQTFYAREEFFPKRTRPSKDYPFTTTLRKIPLVLLTDSGTAAGSEIIAGVLQEYKRAVLVGGKTFGSGSVQTVRQLDKDTAIKLTTAYWTLPSGRKIHDVGITPDHVVSGGITDDGEDSVLIAALNLFKD